MSIINKAKEAEKFFISLQDKNITDELVSRLVGDDLHDTIKNYMEKLLMGKEKLKMDDKSFLINIIVLGFLLKDYLDRCELELRFKDS